MPGLFVWIFLSVWMSKSHKMMAFLFFMIFGDLCSPQLLSRGGQRLLYKHQWMYNHANLDVMWVLVWDSHT